MQCCAIGAAAMRLGEPRTATWRQRAGVGHAIRGAVKRALQLQVVVSEAPESVSQRTTPLALGRVAPPRRSYGIWRNRRVKILGRGARRGGRSCGAPATRPPEPSRATHAAPDSAGRRASMVWLLAGRGKHRADGSLRCSSRGGSARGRTHPPPCRERDATVTGVPGATRLPSAPRSSAPRHPQPSGHAPRAADAAPCRPPPVFPSRGSPRDLVSAAAALRGR